MTWSEGIVRSLFKRKDKKNINTKINKEFSIKLVKNIDKNIKNLKDIFDDPDDLVIREFAIGKMNQRCAVIYIDGLVDTKSIQDNILRSLQLKTLEVQLPENISGLFDAIYQEFISLGNIQKDKPMEEILTALMSGDTVFYLDEIANVLLIDAKGGEFRSIEEPVSETLIRGPRVGFIENIATNIALLRRDIHDPNLRFKTHQIGRRSKKSLSLAYIDGVINPQILAEVNRRLKTIDIDNAPESGYIEEWIEDSFLSPFPQLLNTERPDKVAAALLQGKFAILLDGTPFALIAPVTFGNILQSPEDYYERWTIGSLLRILRYLGAFIAIFLPALYIALVSFHPGMVPSLLAFSISATREGVPFPAFVEAILMITVLELLQEAGARLPQTIGQTIGIVGGLVIGEAAVQAGIVSPIMVIIIALTAIATFAIPAYSVAISFRIIRYGFMIAAATFGLYGIILVYIMLNIHIVNLKSFGIVYSAAFGPFFSRDWHDLVLRAPLTTHTKRPVYMQTVDDTSADKGD